MGEELLIFSGIDALHIIYPRVGYRISHFRIYLVSVELVLGCIMVRRLDQLEAHFHKWRGQQSGWKDKLGFIADGMFCPNGWENDVHAKVLFVLKEPNWTINMEIEKHGEMLARRGVDIQKVKDEAYLSLHHLTQIWEQQQQGRKKKALSGNFQQLKRLAYGLQQSRKDYSPPYQEADSHRDDEEVWRSIAVINLKKTPGGGSASPAYNTYAKQLEAGKDENSAALILGQIKILMDFKMVDFHRFIVCCGTFHTLRGMLNKKIERTSENFFLEELPGVPFLNSRHPAYRRSCSRIYEEVMRRFQECLQRDK